MGQRSSDCFSWVVPERPIVGPRAFSEPFGGLVDVVIRASDVADPASLKGGSSHCAGCVRVLSGGCETPGAWRTTPSRILARFSLVVSISSSTLLLAWNTQDVQHGQPIALATLGGSARGPPVVHGELETFSQL